MRPTARKALIAEDNATVRLLAETVLRGFGFDVTAVSDGAQAQSLLFAEHPDLFVVDVGLPTVNGQLLIGTLRAISRRAKIVAISGFGGDTGTEALRAGADVFLPKPFTREEFEEAVAQAVH